MGAFACICQFSLGALPACVFSMGARRAPRFFSSASPALGYFIGRPGGASLIMSAPPVLGAMPVCAYFSRASLGRPGFLMGALPVYVSIPWALCLLVSFPWALVGRPVFF